MGLILNHMSASVGTGGSGKFKDGASRGLIGVSGSMLFQPGSNAEQLSSKIVSENPDAAYIFSGSSGGTDKALFIGDVVVSGSLSLGGGGDFVDVSGTPVNNQLAIWTDGNTVLGDVDVTYDGTDLLLGATAGTTKLQFRDATEYINSDVDGYLNVRGATGVDLNIAGTDVLNITAASAAVVGALSNTTGATLASASGVVTMGSTTGAVIGAAGIVSVNNATDATTKTDGSLQTDGGLSVAKAIYNGTAATLAADSGVVTMGSTTGATVSAAGVLNVNNATDATTKTDGSLQTDGGLSVAKAIFNGTAATLAADSGVVTMGSTTGATVSAAGVLNVNNATDASTKTDGSLQTDGGLSVAKAIYNGTAATLAADSGVVTMGSTTGATISAAGILNVNNATEATSATNGSLQTDGGLSVVKSAVIGDDLDLLSDGAILTIGSTSKFALTDRAANNCAMVTSGHRLAFGNADEYISGNGTDLDIISSGDLDITATLVDVTGAGAFSGNLTVGGNLDVNGTTTTIDTANLSVQDSIIALGVSGSDGGYSTTGDRGILFPRGADAMADVAGFWWDGTQFNLATSDTSPTSGSFATISGYSNLKAGQATLSGRLLVDDATDATTNADGSLQTDGGLSVTKAIFNSTSATLAAASGVVTMGSTTGATVSALGVLNVNNATDASTKTDGSLQTDGGLSVAKAIYNGTAATLAADSGVVTMGAATALTVSAAGLLNVNNATDATSITDGSLQTDGGLSVTKDAVLGNDLTLISDAAVVAFGVNSDVTLTHVHNEGLLLNAAMELQFRGDESAKISSTAVGKLALSGNNYISLETPTVLFGDNSSVAIMTSWVDGSVNDGSFGWLGSGDRFTFADDVMISSTEKLHFGNDVNSYINHDGTDLQLVDDADINIKPAVNFFVDAGADVILDSGGGTFEFHAAGTEILAIDNSSSDVVFSPGVADKDIIFQEDGGTEICRLDSSAESLLMAASKKVEFGHVDEFIYGDATNLYVESGGNIQIACTALVPDTDNDIDLGSSTKRFANIYTGDLHLANDRGNWTLVEEANMLTFRNNKSGKWFRMVMEEIDGDGRDSGMQGPPPLGGIEV